METSDASEHNIVKMAVLYSYFASVVQLYYYSQSSTLNLSKASAFLDFQGSNSFISYSPIFQDFIIILFKSKRENIGMPVGIGPLYVLLFPP